MIVATPWPCVASSAKPAAMMATPAPIPTAAVATAPPKARILATPAVCKAAPKAKMTCDSPLNAALMPIPIPIAADLTAPPIEPITELKLLKI